MRLDDVLGRLQDTNRQHERRAKNGPQLVDGARRRWGNPPAREQGGRERARRIRQVLTGQLPVDPAEYDAMFEGVVLTALERRATR